MRPGGGHSFSGSHAAPHIAEPHVSVEPHAAPHVPEEHVPEPASRPIVPFWMFHSHAPAPVTSSSAGAPSDGGYVEAPSTTSGETWVVPAVGVLILAFGVYMFWRITR